MRLYVFTAALVALVNGQAVLFPHGYLNDRKISAKDAIYLNLLAQSALEYGGTTIEELNKQADDKQKVPRIGTPNTAGRHGLEKELSLEKHIVAGGEGDRPSTEAPDATPFPALREQDLGKLDIQSPSKPKSPFVRYAPVQRDISEFSNEEEEIDNPFAAIATRPPKNGRPSGHHKRGHHGRKLGAPPTPAAPAAKKQFLNRNQILGVHNNRPRQKKILNVDSDVFTTPPPLPSTSPKAKHSVPKRVPYLDIVLDEPRIVYLPTPPPL